MNYQNNIRINKRYNAVFKVEYDSYKDFLIDYTENISLGGTFIITKENFKIGEKFRVMISFPKIIKAIPVDVEVVWSYEENFDGEVKKGVGVKFLFNDEYHKKKFNKLIEIISKKYEDGKDNKIIKMLFFHSNKFIKSSFIDIIKNINNMEQYRSVNFIIRNVSYQKDIIQDFLQEDFDIIILDTRIHNIEDIITNLKMHKDKVIYIGLGNKQDSYFDFHLKKPFTTSRIESLLNIIVKANEFKD